MTQKITHMIHTPALRIAIIAVLVLSLIGLGWVLNANTNVVPIEPTFTPQSMTVPSPAVTVTAPPKVVTKTVVKRVKVPGPTRTVYVSRAKRCVPVASRPAIHVAPGGVAACIRKWESGGDYRAQNPTSTASGAYQFLDSTWQGVTGLSGRAMNYSPATQDRAFYKLWNGGAGASQWVTAYHCI